MSIEDQLFAARREAAYLANLGDIVTYAQANWPSKLRDTLVEINRLKLIRDKGK